MFIDVTPLCEVEGIDLEYQVICSQNRQILELQYNVDLRLTDIALAGFRNLVLLWIEHDRLTPKSEMICRCNVDSISTNSSFFDVELTAICPLMSKRLNLVSI